MPDVLMLTQDDNANTGWRFFKCIQSLGIDILALKGMYHQMSYPEQIPVHPFLMGKSQTEFPLICSRLRIYAKNAKVIHYIASRPIIPGVNVKEKKVVMQHGGSVYRQNFAMINKFCNQFVDFSIIQCPDLLGLGAKNEHWIYYPVDTDFIKPDFATGNKLKIGHFPSNPITKQSETVCSVIEKLEADPKYNKRFEYVGVRHKGEEYKEFSKNLMMWTDNLKRMKECDIIIESLGLTQKGRIYGEWGNTALEAAALGKIVVTNSLSIDKYHKEYGKMMLNIVNSVEDLENSLKRILSMSDKEIKFEKEETRQWAEDNHSMPVTAKRIWDKVYSHLL